MKENNNSLLTQEDRKYLKLLKQRITNELDKLLQDMKTPTETKESLGTSSPANKKTSATTTAPVEVQQDFFE